mmetsp:Transcript_16750/g.18875  ORF Transcript_16750/g.18875 Transcript_16750/m.18875 type:complete len:105 (+) Transcript_16750:170-484(+)
MLCLSSLLSVDLLFVCLVYSVLVLLLFDIGVDTTAAADAATVTAVADADATINNVAAPTATMDPSELDRVPIAPTMLTISMLNNNTGMVGKQPCNNKSVIACRR